MNIIFITGFYAGPHKIPSTSPLEIKNPDLFQKMGSSQPFNVFLQHGHTGWNIFNGHLYFEPFYHHLRFKSTISIQFIDPPLSGSNGCRIVPLCRRSRSPGSFPTRDPYPPCFACPLYRRQRCPRRARASVRHPAKWNRRHRLHTSRHGRGNWGDRKTGILCQ